MFCGGFQVLPWCSRGARGPLQSMDSPLHFSCRVGSTGKKFSNFTGTPHHMEDIVFLPEYSSEDDVLVCFTSPSTSAGLHSYTNAVDVGSDPDKKPPPKSIWIGAIGRVPNRLQGYSTRESKPDSMDTTTVL